MSTLSQRGIQRLMQRLSPYQIQMIKLLAYPSLQLQQRIRQEIENNPILDEDTEANDEEEEEEDTEALIDRYLKDEDIPSYKYTVSNYSKDNEMHNFYLSEATTISEYLKRQLDYLSLSEKQIVVAEYIIGSLDDDGYLRRDTDFIADDIAFNMGIETTPEEVDEMLYIIQDLDPPGIGARNLQECLLLQIRSKSAANEIQRLARIVLTDYFIPFSKKHYDKIIAKLAVPVDVFREVIEEITSLSPCPVDIYSEDNNGASPHITPDFILEYQNSEFVLSLNRSSIPEMKINNNYVDVMKDIAAKGDKQSEEDKSTFEFMKNKIDAARWFVSAVKQRHITLMTCMRGILDYQKEYFVDGDISKLKPMRMKDVADITGYDVSTVSRVVNGKFIQTHFGTISLKSLFSELMFTKTGEEISSLEIRSIIMEYIESEDKSKPVNDEMLFDLLKDKGYTIARRTVAKYREMLGIPVARLRKEL